MTVDKRYTSDDHDFREDDSYAQAKYDITLRWLRPTHRHGAVLYHVGCGVGIFNRMAVEAGYQVEAFEPDPRAYELAVASQPAGQCRVHPKGLFEVEGEAVADVMVMHDVLEHIDDEVGAVDALRRLVKPNGRIILSVPALPRLFGHHDRQLGHYRRYTPSMLRVALGRHFDVRRMRYFGMGFIPVTLLYSRLLDRPYPVAAVEGKRSLASRGFDALCRFESAVPLPLGTSLVCEAVPLA